MPDLWRSASAASERFASQAAAYDRYRPRYPEELFQGLMDRARLSAGAAVVELGAGTGIATSPLVERGLRVTAVEPAPDLSSLARVKIGDRATIVEERFEHCTLVGPVSLVAAFNAWHWVDPVGGLESAARLLAPGGYLALVWTEVTSWGEDPFEARLATIFGAPWPKRLSHVDASLQPVRDDPRFGPIEVFHHPFERKLDGATYVAVTRTYGGNRTDDQMRAVQSVIDDELGGSVTKREDAVLYLARRNDP
jgi:SAM-dependent methyltransferase